LGIALFSAWLFENNAGSAGGVTGAKLKIVCSLVKNHHFYAVTALCLSIIVCISPKKN